MNRQRLCVLITISLLCVMRLAAQDTTAVRPKAHVPVHFDPARDAAKDISDAVALAQKSHKRIILDVGGEWCIWCRRLDTLFETHDDLAAYLHEHFIPVKVNYSKENENTKVLSRYPAIPGYPHLFVLDENGKLLKSQDTGELESGKHHDPAKVMAFLRKWAPGEPTGNK